MSCIDKNPVKKISECRCWSGSASELHGLLLPKYPTGQKFCTNSAAISRLVSEIDRIAEVHVGRNSFHKLMCAHRDLEKPSNSKQFLSVTHNISVKNFIKICWQLLNYILTYKHKRQNVTSLAEVIMIVKAFCTHKNTYLNVFLFCRHKKRFGSCEFKRLCLCLHIGHHVQSSDCNLLGMHWGHIYTAR